MLLNKTGNYLTVDQINDMRRNGTITQDESVYIVGDMIVAENITTSGRRQIGKISDIMHESKRVILG